MNRRLCGTCGRVSRSKVPAGQSCFHKILHCFAPTGPRLRLLSLTWNWVLSTHWPRKKERAEGEKRIKRKKVKRERNGEEEKIRRHDMKQRSTSPYQLPLINHHKVSTTWHACSFRLFHFSATFQLVSLSLSTDGSSWINPRSRARQCADRRDADTRPSGMTPIGKRRSFGRRRRSRRRRRVWFWTDEWWFWREEEELGEVSRGIRWAKGSLKILEILLISLAFFMEFQITNSSQNSTQFSKKKKEKIKFWNFQVSSFRKS